MHNANSIHMRDDRETISYRCMYSNTIQIDMCVRVWCVFMQSTCRYLRKLPASVRFSNGVEITFCHFLHSSYFLCVFYAYLDTLYICYIFTHSSIFSVEYVSLSFSCMLSCSLPFVQRIELSSNMLTSSV